MDASARRCRSHMYTHEHTPHPAAPRLINRFRNRRTWSPGTAPMCGCQMISRSRSNTRWIYERPSPLPRFPLPSCLLRTSGADHNPPPLYLPAPPVVRHHRKYNLFLNRFGPFQVALKKVRRPTGAAPAASGGLCMVGVRAVQYPCTCVPVCLYISCSAATHSTHPHPARALAGVRLALPGRGAGGVVPRRARPRQRAAAAAIRRPG